MADVFRRPAFQEYAANMMARAEYRLLEAPERGVLWSLRLECWCNQRAPEDADQLARVLGLSVKHVRASLPHLAPFIEVNDGYITCPDLEEYRTQLEHKSNTNAKNGSKGGKVPRKAKDASRTPAAPSINEGSNSSPATATKTLRDGQADAKRPLSDSSNSFSSSSRPSHSPNHSYSPAGEDTVEEANEEADWFPDPDFAEAYRRAKYGH